MSLEDPKDEAAIIAELQELRERKITSMSDAQKLLRLFAARNKWKDSPNVDKFDHLHEELTEMSKFLRYKSPEEREQAIIEHRQEFLDGIGDHFFGLCRLANQLGIDIEEAFNMVKGEILDKYDHKNAENKLIKK